MKKLTVAILAISIVTLGAMFAFGQTEEDKSIEKRRFSQRGKMHKRGGMRGNRLFRHLELTDAQKEQMKAIREASRETTKGLRDSLREGRKQLREMGTNGVFDQGAVELVAAQQAEIHKQLIIERQKVKSQMFALLTPEQKTKLEEMKANFAERRQQRMEKRKARFGENNADQ